MKPNKSIDGLTTRESKTASKSQPARRVTKSKPKTPAPKPIKTEPVSQPTEIPIHINNPDEPSTTVDSIPVSEIREQTIEDFLSPVQALNFDADTGKLTADPAQTSTKSTEDSSKMSTKPQKTKKKPSKARRTITIILLVIVLIITGGVIWAIFWGNDIIAKITGGQGNVFDLLSFTNETYEPLKTDSNGRTNILAFGTSGYDMSGDTEDGTHDGAQLTDSIMMISLNQDTGDIAMVSLPRDLKVASACYAGKINEVYTCYNPYGDDEAAGATALMDTVGDILGVDFQYYAHLNWGSLVSIVDTLGGITVTLDEDIADYGWTDAEYQAGVPYTINGEEALGLARARHGTMGGDFTRGASQQKILIGIKNRIFEKDLSIADLLSLASTLGDNLRTNFSLSDLKTLAHLTRIFDFDSMRHLALVDYDNDIYYMTTGTINDISYVIPSAGDGNYYAIQEYISENLSNDPRDYEHPTIIVLNATDTAGLAAAERTKLLEAGYKDVYTDNAPEGEYYHGYTIYETSTNKPGTALMLDKFYNSDVLTADEIPANITRDYDFIIIVNPKSTAEE